MSSEYERLSHVYPPGIVFLEDDRIYEFSSRSASRSVIVEGPAGKPYIIRLTNGDLLLAYTRGYVADLGKAITEGYWSEIRRSSDEGRTWSEPVKPFPDVPNTKEATLVELSDGAILCFVHSGKPELHTPKVSVSNDGGRTWSASWDFPVAEFSPSGKALSNRQHITLESGEIIVFVSDFFSDRIRTWACRSTDQARSWDEYWHVGDHIGDQSFVRLPSGTFLAAVRIYGEDLEDKRRLPYGYHEGWAKGLGGGEAHDYIAISESTDGGRTWSQQVPVTRYGEVPAHLLPLANGTIVLTYGVRHYPMGAQAVMSYDDGKSWDTEHRRMLAWHGAPYCGSLPDWGHAYPNGHPYSVELEDGSVYTTYYRTNDPSDYRSTVIEAVRWRL